MWWYPGSSLSGTGLSSRKNVSSLLKVAIASKNPVCPGCDRFSRGISSGAINWSDGVRGIVVIPPCKVSAIVSRWLSEDSLVSSELSVISNSGKVVKWVELYSSS